MASFFAIIGVIIQECDDGHEHVIYYISKQLSGPTLNYSHGKNLALTIVLCVQKLPHYILLCKTKTMVNLNPIEYILESHVINGKCAKWVLILKEHNAKFSTLKSNKALDIAKFITTSPIGCIDPPINDQLLDERLFQMLSYDEWYGDIITYLCAQ